MKRILYIKDWAMVVIFILVAPMVYGDNDITIENAEMRLVISEEGHAKSLIHKATGQECLAVQDSFPVFAVKQSDRLPSQEMLVHPAEPKFLPATKVRRMGNKLKISFRHLSHRVTVRLDITDSYIGFTVDNIKYNGSRLSERLVPPLDELIFLRLPVRERDHFGGWLNVMHDADVAVNVLATNQYPKVDGKPRCGYRIMEARAIDEVKTLGVSAALITTETKHLMDRIQQVEKDFNLPTGVKSRSCEEYKYSVYWPTDITPDNVDRHVQYAKAGGFKLFMISVNSFATVGHFSWNEEYSNGMEDFNKVVDKVTDAGMIPGLHTYFTKADKEDPYVTGTPDHRLNLRRRLTLAEPITRSSTTITVEENPRACTREDGRRILKIGEELITYQDYTTERPFQFTGCRRGQFETTPQARDQGYKFGLLDVDTWTKWVRYDQRTSIQQEVAERIGEIYNQAGLRFIYFDGAEDVPPPYWYNTSRAQKVLYDQLQPPPIFAEAAQRSHFSWHMISRANAFDIQGYPPKQLKSVTRRDPMREARILQADFTKGDFGWIANHPPGYWEEDSVGMQPDAIEYSTSRAAGWSTGTSLWTKLSWSDPHPRSDDIFEVFKRWETAREKNWLSEEQKAALRNPNQEHILLRNENDEFELRPYYQITLLPTKKIRAFHFQRNGKTYVVYWHTLGKGQFLLPIEQQNIKAFGLLDGDPLPIKARGQSIVLPAGSRRYLEFTNLSKQQIIEAFRGLRLLPER